jgi:hypothetical protein
MTDGDDPMRPSFDDDLANSTRGVETETSWAGRLVSILTPFAAIAAGWLAALVAKHTGVELDQTQITAFIAAASLSALTAGWKWLTGWQQHERLVAQGLAVPIGKQKATNRQAPVPPPTAVAAVMGTPPPDVR